MGWYSIVYCTILYQWMNWVSHYGFTEHFPVYPCLSILRVFQIGPRSMLFVWWVMLIDVHRRGEWSLKPSTRWLWLPATGYGSHMITNIGRFACPFCLHTGIQIYTTALLKKLSPGHIPKLDRKEYSCRDQNPFMVESDKLCCRRRLLYNCICWLSLIVLWHIMYPGVTLSWQTQRLGIPVISSLEVFVCPLLASQSCTFSGIATCWHENAKYMIHTIWYPNSFSSILLLAKAMRIVVILLESLED